MSESTKKLQNHKLGLINEKGIQIEAVINAEEAKVENQGSMWLIDLLELNLNIAGTPLDIRHLLNDYQNSAVRHQIFSELEKAKKVCA